MTQRQEDTHKLHKRWRRVKRVIHSHPLPTLIRECHLLASPLVMQPDAGTRTNGYDVSQTLGRLASCIGRIDAEWKDARRGSESRPEI